ncbi:hypothetical protein F5887DRAFT_479505 [Amanita rubescens]|nr:hypothetical protein F5887DRAFT_479505 [Amanita rubescens]
MTLPHIHKIPAEILQHIFHLCCADCMPYLKPHSAVLLLVQVCSRWRQLLLDAPMFWDEVTISGDSLSQLSLASLWLSRAGLRPRSFRTMRASPAAPIQSLLARFSFSSLDLAISENLDFSEIPIESVLPLKSLFLRNTNSHSPQISLGHHSFPNLSTLIWNNFDSFSPLMTSKTIEELFISGPVPISLHLEILHSATKLRELVLRSVNDAETVASIQDVVAPNLTDLRMHFTHGYSAGPLVSALTAPNLKRLTMATRLDDPGFTCDASSFLLKAGQSRMPKLEDLSIDSKTSRPIDIGILLRSIPSLRTLRLKSETILDEDTMQGLASGELGPRLWDMGLLDQYTPHDPERILTMIEARRGRFNSFEMNFFFVVRDDGKFNLDEYERRTDYLAPRGVKVRFHFV